MTPLQTLGLELALAVVIAFLPSGAIAFLCGLAALAAPFLTRTDQPVLIFFLTTYAGLIAMRMLDLVLHPEGFTPLRRLWHLHAFFDTRLVVSRERGFEGRLLLAALAWFLCGQLALVAGMVASHELTGPLRSALRWSTCGFLFLSNFEGLTRTLQAVYAPLGLRPPPIHDDAWAARSVGEFWGARWNKAVGTWLREHVYTPFARRGSPRLGVAAAFVTSALLHCYLILPALGAVWAAVMGLFFVAQIALMALERRLGVKRWSPIAAHAWTLGVLLLASPLFCEPASRLFDPIAAALLAK